MQIQTALQIARASYASLVLWQAIWLMLLPAPAGKQNLILGAVLTAPLLLPLWGVLKMKVRSLIWAGYLGLMAGVFAIVELWAAPAERLAASLQLLLCLVFLFSLARGTPKGPRRKR